MKTVKVVGKPDKCPECGGRIVPVIYGEPTYEAFLESEKGNVMLGGCIVEFDDEGNCLMPTWECSKCHVRIIATEEGEDL